MLTVIKRNGTGVPFETKKIAAAIKKAFEATNTVYAEDSIDMMALRVTAAVTKEVNPEENWIDIEKIQDLVEKTLSECGYTDVAKAYILYRKLRAEMREKRDAKDLYASIMDTYLTRGDREEDKNNASVTWTLGGGILANSECITKQYYLNRVYDQAIKDAYEAGDIYIHDMGMLSGYCAGWSLKQLIKEGLGGVEGKISSAPASHLNSLVNQMVNFLGIMQNEWAGAQAFSSFDTYLAPFVRVDNLSYKEVKQAIQNFVFGVNVPSRWGTQAPFSNITLDWTVPEDLSNLPAIVGGKDMDFTYGDCKKEMDMVNKAFLEVMIEGDANGRGFSYPIPTYSITRDFDWSDTENNRLLFEMTAKYGTPYFSNYVNSDMNPSDVRSMCCRLRLDLRELRKKNGGFFGAGESTGSVGVVTINMPAIGYQSKTKEEFFQRLDHMMNIAARSLHVKRQIVTELLEEGLYPYTKRYLGSFDNHFSTIGLVGMNEACKNASFIKKDLTAKESQDFTVEVLNHMRERLKDYQEQYPGELFNLEATPAESTAFKLALRDKKRFPDIITAGTEEDPYYTNSSNLPVGYTDDIFSALDIQDRLQPLYTSGTVFHAFLGEKLPSWESAAKLVKAIAHGYHIPYFSMSPTYSICETHGYITGEHFECPTCGKNAEVYSRITGYYRPVKQWNDGKTQEYKERKEYKPDLNKIKSDSDSCNDGFCNFTPTTTSDSVSSDVIIKKDGVYLFTKKSCPNCVMAKKLLDKKGIEYVVIDAEEQAALSMSLKIMAAPTLVIINGDLTTKVAGFPNIKKWVETK